MDSKSLPVALRTHVASVEKLLRVKASVPEIATFLGITEEDVALIQYRLVNKTALIRAQLATGPKTTREIVDATKLPVRIASALLSELRRKGRVEVIGRGPRRSDDPSDLIQHPVYRLTESGRARMKKLGEAA